MAQQNYLRNVPFNTYELSDLKAADGNSAWTWEGRTLVGYISADNYDNIIPLGSELTVGTERADLKGAWNLNKRRLSVYIDGAGPDTYIDVITETHPYYGDNQSCRPLTDAIVRNETSVYSSGEVVRYWYNSRISCAIHPGENRTISAVWYSTSYVDESDFRNHGDVSSLIIPNEYASSMYSWTCASKVLSVYLVEGGIMRYAANKNTLLPTHPALDD